LSNWLNGSARVITQESHSPADHDASGCVAIPLP
jgi:hypothetical protein